MKGFTNKGFLKMMEMKIINKKTNAPHKKPNVALAKRLDMNHENDITKKKMTLNKGTNGLMRMPFTDNYHGVEIDVEQVTWEQEKPYIDFDMVSNDKTAYVETNTFFKCSIELCRCNRNRFKSA